MTLDQEIEKIVINHVKRFRQWCMDYKNHDPITNELIWGWRVDDETLKIWMKEYFDENRIR